MIPQIQDFAAKYASRGHLPATSGNFSFLSPQDKTGTKKMVVTVSGRDKSNLQTEDFISLSLDMALWKDEAPSPPSAESALHLAIYKKLPNTQCILHTHHPKVIGLDHLMEGGEVTFSGLEILKGIEGITTHEVTWVVPAIKNSQCMDTLVRQWDKWWGVTQRTLQYALLVRGHGVYVWGSHFAQALRHYEVVDTLLDYLWMREVIHGKHFDTREGRKDQRNPASRQVPGEARNTL